MLGVGVSTTTKKCHSQHCTFWGPPKNAPTKCEVWWAIVGKIEGKHYYQRPYSCSSALLHHILFFSPTVHILFPATLHSYMMSNEAEMSQRLSRVVCCSRATTTMHTLSSNAEAVWYFLFLSYWIKQNIIKVTDGTHTVVCVSQALWNRKVEFLKHSHTSCYNPIGHMPGILGENIIGEIPTLWASSLCIFWHFMTLGSFSTLSSSWATDGLRVSKRAEACRTPHSLFRLLL